MLILGIASTGYLNAQSFSEDFEQGIPNTWTLYNQDGRTPAPTVSYVNAAWVARGDGAGDTFAVSTSWYAPPGAADDWLVTPAITIGAGEILSWEAFAPDPDYRDGYEVRISTTGNAIGDFMSTPPLFAIANENNAWTPRYVDLAAEGYENQTIYIAFRNNSIDLNILRLDNILISDVREADGGLSASPIIGYSAAPLKQVQDYEFSIRVENFGSDTLKNAFVNFQIYNYSTSQWEYNHNTDTVNILAGGVDTLDYSITWLPSDTGTYVLSYLLISDNDVNANNDTVFDVFFVTDTIYARATGNPVAALGLPPAQAVNGGYLGISYEIVQPTALTSVEGIYYTPPAGDSTKISVYRFTNGLPELTPVAISDNYVFTGDTDQVVTFTFPSLVILQPDTYLIASRQYSGYMSLYGLDQKFTQGTHWLFLDILSTTNWFPFEAITGISQSTPALNANFGACPVTIDTAYVIQPTCPDNRDGLLQVEATPNYGGLSFTWSNGETDSILEFLGSDVYTVTVEDGIGCQTTQSYDLALVDPIGATVSITNAADSSSADGAITVTTTGGTGPYTYEWSNGETTASLTNLGPGEYEVTVTDASGCENEFTATVSAGVGIFNIANTLAAKLYPNPASNQVFVEVALEKAADVKIEVVNNLGQTVISQTEAGVQLVNTKVNIATLSSGIYLVKITAGEASSTQKLIVE